MHNHDQAGVFADFYCHDFHLIVQVNSKMRHGHCFPGAPVFSVFLEKSAIKGVTAMRYRVELLNLSEAGEKRERFHLVVYAQNADEAIAKAQKDYAEKHPDSPLPPEGSSWISYGTREEDCWG